MIIKEKKRLRPIQKYKIGQWVYVYHENYLQRVLISGVLFKYNGNPHEMAFTEPEYIVELNIGCGAHYTACKEEYEIFKRKIDCIFYVLKYGLIKEKE